MAYRLYSDERRQEALELYAQAGLNEAARRSGIHKSTLREWAVRAHLDTRAITETVSDRNRRAAAASAQQTFRERQEMREEALNKLGKISVAALIRELQILTSGEFATSDLQAITNARQKAIQQLELLEGRATTRVDYGMEQMLGGVAIAFRAILPTIAERVSQAFADEITGLFAAKLREARDDVERALRSGETIEDADFEPAGIVTAAARP